MTDKPRVVGYVAPDVRLAALGSLRPGESLSSMLEMALLREIERRQCQRREERVAA